MTAKPNSPIARDLESVVHPFSNLAALPDHPPTMITHGKGIYVYDDNGKEYMEGASGMWCASLGFGDEELIDAAIKQFRKLPWYHSFVDKTIEPVGILAEKLKAIAPVPMARVLFVNSGSEANDTMAKLVWYYNNARGRPEKKKIIGRINGFHGLTIGAGSLTGIPVMHADFDLPIANVLHTENPYYYRRGEPGESEEAFATRMADALEALILAEGPDTVAAFIAEPVMGAGGVITPPATYFEKIQAVLARYDVLMLADEVICGFGRTGNMFGCDTYAIKPHMMTMAKGLSSAYQPIAALMICDEIWQAMVEQSRKQGMFAHAFTTSGHPVAVAVATRVVELMEERDILGHVRRIAPRLQDGLRALADHPLVGDVRGVGLMAGVEIVADKATRRGFDPAHGVKKFATERLLELGLITRAGAASDTFAFSPPLIITAKQIDEMIRRFTAGLDATAAWVETNGLQAA